jgi:hypothetical protein
MKKLSILGRALQNAAGDIDLNSAGFQFAIDTLSTIRAKVITQKHYKVDIPEFIDVLPGEGGYGSEIVQNGQYMTGGDFYEGDTDVGGSQISTVGVAQSPIRTPTQAWRKKATWTIYEVAEAANSGNWDVIAGKMESLKKNWDLGIQAHAFLGRGAMAGLLTSDEVTINTTLITEKISGMSATEFQDFVAKMLDAFFTNANATEMPNRLVMPYSDFLGMGSASSDSFPIGSKIDYLLDAFRRISGKEDFKILPLAYCDAARNAGVGLNKDRYVLYNKDVETVSLPIPVDFTMLEAKTINGYDFEQLAHGMYAGALFGRKREVLYIDLTAGT